MTIIMDRRERWCVCGFWLSDHRRGSRCCCLLSLSHAYAKNRRSKEGGMGEGVPFTWAKERPGFSFTKKLRRYAPRTTCQFPPHHHSGAVLSFSTLFASCMCSSRVSGVLRRSADTILVVTTTFYHPATCQSHYQRRVVSNVNCLKHSYNEINTYNTHFLN